MMPRRAPDRARILAAAGIVALHVGALLFIQRHDRLHIPAQAAAVYAQLLLPLPAPKQAPVAPAPASGPAVFAPASRPMAPAPRVSAARPVTPVPSSAPLPAPDNAARAAHAPAVAPMPDGWADAPAPAATGKVNVAALVAAAGADERARPKEPLERVRDGQRLRATIDDSPAARAIAKSGRPDCTKKYSGGANLDPLRLIPLLYDTVTDTGCRW